LLMRLRLAGSRCSRSCGAGPPRPTTPPLSRVASACGMSCLTVYYTTTWHFTRATCQLRCSRCCANKCKCCLRAAVLSWCPHPWIILISRGPPPRSIHLRFMANKRKMIYFYFNVKVKINRFLELYEIKERVCVCVCIIFCSISTFSLRPFSPFVRFC
jgi:hypothetical protein